MKISIITINYNNAKGLEKTITSVKQQEMVNHDDFEFIIIDGLSNDGSSELIKGCKILSKYVIEADTGIADAFNKGITMSSGDYLYFLNSGDIFYDQESLSAIIKSLNQNDTDILINKITMVDNKGDILYLAGKKINLQRQKFRNYLPHQAMFIKRELFKIYGLYDTKFKLGMDYEWSTRLLKDKNTLNLKFSNFVVCRMQDDGVSQTHYVETFKAYHKARMKNNVMHLVPSYLIFLFSVFKRTIGIFFRKNKQIFHYS